MTPDEFKEQIDTAGEGLIGACQRLPPEEFEVFVGIVTSGLKTLFNTVDCVPLPEAPALPPPDLELIATGYDCDGPSHGNRAVNDAFIEAFFQLPGAPADELPKQIAINSVAKLSVPPAMYDLKLSNNAMVQLNGTHHGTSTTVDLQSMDAKCNGWNDDNSSGWSLYPVGVNNKFRHFIGDETVLGDGEWSRVNDSPRVDSEHLQFEQQSSKVWGSDYDLFFEYAKSDVLISVPHLVAKPLSTFFLDELAGKGRAFGFDTGHKVYVKYSNDLLGDHGQCEWIREYAGKFYPDLDSDKAYARMVGFFAAGIHFQMANTWDGFQFVLPLGFDPIMLTEYRKVFPDYEVVWCRQSDSNERSWELLK